MNPWIANLLRAAGRGSTLPSSGQTFYASLKNSLVPEVGTGGPTWSRDTKAWGFNELGYLEELASGCAFFGGARLVRNFIRNSALDNATWSNTGLTITAGQTDYLGGTSAFLLMETAATSNHVIGDDVVSPGAGRVMVICVVAKANGRDKIRISDNAYGAVSATFDLSAGTSVSTVGTSTITSLGGGYYKCIAKTSGSLANNPFYPRIYIYNGGVSYAGDITKGVILSHVQVSSVTNYDASYIPEYVSVGSDTDKNFLLHTDDFSQAAWNKTNITITQSAIANPVNGLINAQKVEATAGALTTFYQSCLNSGSTAGNIFACYVKQGSGATDANRFVVRNQTTTTNLLSVTVNYSTGGITYLTGSSGASVTDAGNGWWLVKLVVTSGVSTNDNIWIYAGFGGAAETAGKFFYIYRPYLGRGTTAPAVIPAVAGVWDPFGAGIDGAKYFETDWQGAPIPTANLTRLRKESSATNALLWSRDLSNAAWSTKTNITAAKTATGLDGIANSATTLTATVSDAIILQPTSGIASAARCASAHVERVAGTGTISFTQDGGSTWTDITPNINPDTFSRVQITATLANPSVGFKISTAGDVIAVDCVQNEAGSVATSPIVTTTTTVNRNADSLTYQTAGNIDFAVGTAYCEAQLTSATSTRRAIYVGAVAASFIDGGTTVWKAYDGTNTVTKSGLSDASTAKRKRVVTWGTGMSVTGDGLTPASGLFDGAFGGAATIEIGQAINGYIGPVAIYNYQMTDAELQAITT